MFSLNMVMKYVLELDIKCLFSIFWTRNKCHISDSSLFPATSIFALLMGEDAFLSCAHTPFAFPLPTFGWLQPMHYAVESEIREKDLKMTESKCCMHCININRNYLKSKYLAQKQLPF